MPQTWQFFEYAWHICHSWRDLQHKRITAMTLLILILATAIGALALWFLNRVIDADGFGRRPAPRSHAEELDPRPSAARSLAL
jgi:uncharacterized membrane protein